MSSSGGGSIIPHSPIVPVLQPGQSTFIGRAIAWLKGEAAGGLASLTDFIEHKAFPFVKNLFVTIAMDVQAKLAPVAEAAVEEMANDLPLLVTQGWEGFLKAEGAVFTKLLQTAQADITDATITDVRVAAHSATLNKWLTLGGTASAS